LSRRGIAANIDWMADRPRSRSAAARPPSSERDAGHDPPDAEFRALFDHAPLGMGVADMEGNLLAFNEAIRQPGGYTREEILAIGNVSALYASPAERERVLAIARKQGYLRREEVQFRSQDGSPYDTLLTLTPVRFRGRPCWFAVVEDITERKRAEAQRLELEAELRQAQKMEAVGRMTGGIAHDFNNLLTVILTSAELVSAQLPVGAVDVRRDLDELLAAARRGVTTIRKLLGFSRQSALRVAPTDVAELVRTLEGMLRRLLDERIALEIDVAPFCTALVDPGAVEQMVMNLATNARDAMQQGGVLRIGVRSVTLTAEQAATNGLKVPATFVRLSASDTGVGMDEHTRARALEPFFTTKPAGAGTGLGLAMVYGLVTQQNGFVEIESRPGRGTTVHLYFPSVTAA
jgi:two-component system cell cycle sensor histidine kinase/response regulator CckA